MVFHESERDVFYLGDGIEVSKRWTRYPPNSETPRVRKGGLVFSKRTGGWYVFTLGPLGDIGDDGMPDMGLMFQEKVGNEYINNLGPAFPLIDRDGVVQLPAVAHGVVPLQ